MAMTNRIMSAYDKASSSDNGFYAWCDGQMAVYVAVGKAAEKRNHPGKVVVGCEWRRPEGVSDDDLSLNGFLLQPKGGTTRVSADVNCDTIEEAVSKIEPLVTKKVFDWATFMHDRK